MDFIKCVRCENETEVKYVFEEVGDCESGPIGLVIVDYECVCDKCGLDIKNTAGIIE